MKNKIRKLSYLKDTLANSYQNFSTFTPHKKFCYIHLDSYMKIAVAPTSKAVFTIHPTLPACPSLLPWQLQSTQSLSLVARQAIAPTTKSRYVYCKLRSCLLLHRAINHGVWKRCEKVKCKSEIVKSLGLKKII